MRYRSHQRSCSDDRADSYYDFGGRLGSSPSSSTCDKQCKNQSWFHECGKGSEESDKPTKSRCSCR